MALRLPIKVKSAGALAVPLAILLAVAGLEVAQSGREVQEVREETDLATAAIGPAGLVNALQNERNYSGLWLVGSEGVVDLPVDSFEDARAATDASITAFRAEVERKGGDVERLFGPALDRLTAPDGLPAQRAVVDGYTGPRLVTEYNATADQSFADYTELVEVVADPTTQLYYEVEDEDLRRGVQLVDLASREVDGIAQVVRDAIVISVRGDGRIGDREEIRHIASRVSEMDRQHLRIVELASGTPTYADIGEELYAESEETRVRQIAWRIVETGDVDIPGLLTGISLEDDESYYGFIHDVSGVIRQRSDDLNAAAVAQQRTFVAVAGLALLVSAIATPLFARSITRPLRALTRQAKDMAHRRLPDAVRSVHDTPLGQDVVVPELEPVAVTARDEVADVADMLNRVQSTALDLAVEQAVLRHNVADAFVNLARRNQNLLGRQLDFITKLESDEARPETLADLFRLDHQATRMRRNAESLLVLAGVEPRRHATPPARLGDVVRGALGEVAGYQRVAVQGIQPAVLVGPAVADLAHLLAELIENALRYTPPHRGVDVRGHGTRDGYDLAVIDHGPGMPPEEIARANRRLAAAEEFTVAPSQYLGHYVTAALATRHGMSVELRPGVGPSGTPGITAIVHLPSGLLVGHGSPARTAAPAPAPAPALRPAPAPARRPESRRVAVPSGHRGPALTAHRLATPPTPQWTGDVYGVLSRFTAAVRQGRHDARVNPPWGAGRGA